MTVDVRTILVTGGTGKLGRVILDGFARLGDIVVTTSRRPQQTLELQRRWRDLGAADVHIIEADLAAPAGVHSLIGRLISKGIAPHVLVNNARDIANVKPDQDGRIARTQWVGEFALGVVSPYELSIGLATMDSTPLRSVINVASMYGVVAANPSLYNDPHRESPINYGVVKAGLIHLTRELAVRLSPRILVNSVSYGGVEGRVDDAFVNRYAQLCPAGRMLREDEVFEPVRFLADVGSSGITAHNLIVDGGWTAW